jgi:hypothetical protein
VGGEGEREGEGCCCLARDSGMSIEAMLLLHGGWHVNGDLVVNGMKCRGAKDMLSCTEYTCTHLSVGASWLQVDRAAEWKQGRHRGPDRRSEDEQ